MTQPPEWHQDRPFGDEPRFTSVWLFGSRAAGCATPNSDWDFLVLSPSNPAWSRQHRGTADIVHARYDTPLESSSWLCSELAAHVAVYGELLSGRDDWTPHILPLVAAERKRETTIRRALALTRVQSFLSGRLRAARVLAVRRDVQRVWWLTRRQTVPPSAVLDAEWWTMSSRDQSRLVATALPSLALATRAFIELEDPYATTHPYLKAPNRRTPSCQPPPMAGPSGSAVQR